MGYFRIIVAKEKRLKMYLMSLLRPESIFECFFYFKHEDLIGADCEALSISNYLSITRYLRDRDRADLIITLYHHTSVATKIENGPKMNTKILRFLKMDQRRIQESSLIKKFFEDLR